MAEVKLTKNELRIQQIRLGQLDKYLPTLQLKKAMLQAEVSQARLEIGQFEENFSKQKAAVEDFSALLGDRTIIDSATLAKVKNIQRRYENIAGIEVPFFGGIEFEPLDYSLYDTPPWLDSMVLGLRSLVEAQVKVKIAREKKAALEKELRQVSLRVNLFEKILIPRCLKTIKKIKVFLGDQELASVSRAKVAKGKIEERQLLERKQCALM